MKRAGAALVAFAVLGCSADPPPGEEQRTRLALAALEDNIATTDYSARVDVTGSRVRDTDLPSTGNDDMLAIEYSAAVLETYRGASHDRIRYLQLTDADDAFEGRTRGEVIVSLCRGAAGGGFYLPEIGYELPAAPALIERARELGRHLAEASGSAEAPACR